MVCLLFQLSQSLQVRQVSEVVEGHLAHRLLPFRLFLLLHVSPLCLIDGAKVRHFLHTTLNIFFQNRLGDSTKSSKMQKSRHFGPLFHEFMPFPDTVRVTCRMPFGTFCQSWWPRRNHNGWLSARWSYRDCPSAVLLPVPSGWQR